MKQDSKLIYYPNATTLCLFIQIPYHSSKYDTMVNDGSTVLPVAVAFESKVSVLSLANGVASFSLLRSNILYQDDGWINEDHCTESDKMEMTQNAIK